MNKNSICNGLKAPCKDCPDRVLGCHNTCKKYLTYKKRWDYLRAVIKPFRDKVAFISKQETPTNTKTKEYICMLLNSKEGTSWEDFFALPYFEVGTMYKGMELEKNTHLRS